MKRFLALLFVFLGIFIFSFCSNNHVKNLKSGFIPINQFGSNPGNLRMYLYKPAKLKKNPELIIALHGCMMNAKAMQEAGNWGDLAEKYGFLIIFPEQKTQNQPNSCFNWYLKSDNLKDKGESASIIQMLDYVQKSYSIGKEKTFITGISAGGAMSLNLLASYPNRFKAGSIIASVPYKAYTLSHFYKRESKQLTLSLMFAATHSSNRTATHWNNCWIPILGEQGKAPEKNLNNSDFERTDQIWGNLVRSASPNYKGNYPKLLLIHGTKDPVVNYKNFNDILKQWRNLFNLHKNSEKKSLISNQGILREYYKHKELVIKGVLLKDFIHAHPIDLNLDKNAIANPGPPHFTQEVKGFHYPLETLKFFKITNKK